MLEIPAEMIDDSLLTGKDVVIGIRPHNFELVDGPENALTLHTDYIEHLGKEYLYRCYMGETKLRVITPINVKRSAEDVLYVRPQYEMISVFDKQTRNIISY